MYSKALVVVRNSEVAKNTILQVSMPSDGQN